MKYPKEVQDRINVLNKYQVNPNLTTFNILHIYPGRLAYPTGMCDARYFRLVGFNTIRMEKRDLGSSVDCSILENGIPVTVLAVFADGAVLVKFKNMAKLLWPPGQTVYFTEATA